MPNFLQKRSAKPLVEIDSIYGGNCSSGLHEVKEIWDEGVILAKCQKTAHAVVRYRKSGDPKVYGCTVTYKCGEKYNNGTGYCNLGLNDCYHQEGCLVPKNQKLPNGNCEEKTWLTYKPQYCSVISSGPNCSRDGHVVKLAWIILPSGDKKFVSMLKIEHAQIKSISESYWEDKSYQTGGIITGSEEYCSKSNSGSICSSGLGSNGINPYRVFNFESEIPIAHFGSCKTPIYCSGYEDVLVYDFKTKTTRTECANCHISCDDKDVNIVVPEAARKIIRLCGRQDCEIFQTVDKIITKPRNFHQKISDERIIAEISDDQKTFTYTLTEICPLLEICSAIDCTFCRVRLINPSCYYWYHWFLALTLLYIILILLGGLLIAMKPVLRLGFIIVNIAFKVTLKTLKLFAGKSKLSYQVISNYANDSEKTTRSLEKMTPKENRAHIGSSIIIIICLMGLIKTIEAEVLCSDGVVDNVSTQVCKRAGSQYECVIGSLAEVPMISYDQTSCLHFISPGGRIMGELQITPKDLSFKCVKETLYFTRDVTYSMDHVMRCPHAGECSDNWCNKVDENTKVEGIPFMDGIQDQMCKLGAACAGAGCFYCTNSCHTIRYYPKPKTSDLFEVFFCPKWEPSGIFHFEWRGTTSHRITLSLIHGETVKINPNIRVTLQMTVQAKLPILNKNFLQKGKTLAAVNSSPANQPIPGTIGHLQCPTARDAVDLTKKCIMAPNACVCRPSGDSDSCDCSNVDLESAYHSETQLPLVIGSDYLTFSESIPYLKSSAYGSASIRVHATGTLVGDSTEEEECKISFSDLAGCHSCVVGAKFKYKCDTTKPVSIVAQCGGNVNVVLECDRLGLEKIGRVHVPSPIVDINCQVSCSKKPIKLVGILKSVGLHPIGEGSHIQLSPNASITSLTNWIKSIRAFLSWWWMVALLLIGLLLILFAVAVTNQFLSIMKRKRQ